jgi:two-component system, LuxR family, response regulator FixJ
VSPQHPVVAVIDDNLNVLNSMTRLLATHGFDVEPYVSPGKFLEAVITTQASCLVVDVQVAEGCGVEFVRQLVSLGITFPVIFIGANDNEELERRAIGIGCVAFFREPLSAYLLVEALYDLADSYSARSPGQSVNAVPLPGANNPKLR